MPETSHMSDPEFCRRVRVASVPAEGLEVSVTASERELDALSRRFGLNDMSRLEARVVIEPWESGVEVRGTLEAVIAQICVVTLEAFESEVRESFHSRFLPPERIGVFSGNFDGPDDPEPLEDGCVDIGELTAQQLALSLDPAPQSPAAARQGGRGEAADESEREPGAFSALSRLKE